MKIIDQESWKRREHFEYFSGLDDPYWSIVTTLNCSKTFQQARSSGTSFFLSYLHQALLATLKVEEMRLRVVDGQIVCYDCLHASATVLRDDETFGCCFIEFKQNFDEFCENARMQIEATKMRSGMCLERDVELDQIHFSTIPWQSFSGLTYARNLKPQDSVPKITFGAVSKNGEQNTMPVAIQVHHGLIDGLHVARYLEELQKTL